MEEVAGSKKKSSSNYQYERQRLEVPELRPWGVPKYQVPAFADVRASSILVILCVEMETSKHSLNGDRCIAAVDVADTEATHLLVG